MDDKSTVKLPALFQIGVVVKDIEKTMEYYTATFGIGPWRVVEVERRDVMVRGQKSPYRVKIAFANLGGVEMELMQMVAGKSLYNEFLDKGREGLHHLGFMVTGEERERMVARLAEAGIGITETAKTQMYKGSYTYFDTEQIGGVIFELIHREQ